MSHPPTDQAQREKVPVDLTDPLTDLDGAFRVAQLMSQSSMVPMALRGSPQNCLVTMLLGRELGLSWIQAIRGIYVLPSGQPGLRGELLLARIRQAGHKYEFKRGEDSCTCIITRKDEEFKVPYEGEFTVEDAKMAQLVTVKDGKLIARSTSGQPMPWEMYRRDMLQWRAVARAAKIGVPELIFGFDLAGTGEGADEPVAPPALGLQPAVNPVPEQDLAEMRRQLEELGQRTVIYHAPPETLGLPEKAEDGADYEVTAPPTARDLQLALNSCGYRGAELMRTVSALIRRHVDHLTELSPAEILMAWQPVHQITHANEMNAVRKQKVADLAERAMRAWRDAEETDDGPAEHG